MSPPRPKDLRPGAPSRGADALDGTDLAILAGLVEDGRATGAALAARAGVAESTCAVRLRSLVERGVVRRVVADVDPAALGCPLQAVVKVRLGTHDRAHVAAIYDHLVRVPGVLRVLHLAGEDDFLVDVVVQDAQHLRDLVLEHVTGHPAVRQVETHLVFEERRGPGAVPAAPPRGTAPRPAARRSRPAGS